ncbi:tRNA pseudouridine(55) synthase TruB [Gracilibacillus dipsosauri]|uniref:tRNA pseudouridine(55) synthase TruB n=1 Tax=Gracilibacillus dipsosauri TaxID=178340 RepID=UPI00240962B6
MNGILPLWKPKGMTSHDCVIKIRKLFKTKKVGHTGTLDPEVEGVLPICVGEATKIVPFLTDTVKTYIATATIGTSTTTEDHTGEIIERKPVSSKLSSTMIEETLDSFQGKIQQQVPYYSAVKVNGKKLYEYARNNERVERPIRSVCIEDIRLITTSYDEKGQFQSIQFEVTCSKGTYIRTLCLDLGKKLQFPAHMSNLIRSRSGHFTSGDTWTFEELENDTNETVLLPLKHGLAHLDAIEVDEQTMKKVKNGQKLSLPSTTPKTKYFRIEHKGMLLAIYHIHENQKEIKPARVFSNK